MIKYVTTFMLVLIFSTYSYAQCGGGTYKEVLPGDLFVFCWSPNSEPDLAGYRSYISTTSDDYIYVSQNQENNNLYSIYNLVRNNEGNIIEHPVESPPHSISTPGLYYFILTAFDTRGLESDRSDNEISILVKEPITSPTNLRMISITNEQDSIIFKNTIDSTFENTLNGEEGVEYNEIEE